MFEISKYEQNNHNGNGTNRQIVTLRTKTPNVQMLTISNVSSDILEALDELAAKQDRSRSSFVRRELKRIVAGCRVEAA